MIIDSVIDIYKRKSRRDCNLDIYISLKNDFVYFMVCKSASSTVTYHLQFAEYEGTRFTVQDVNNTYTSPHLRPFQLKDEDFLEILRSPKFRKISFVRNPYTRVLSCYLHRIIGERRMNPSKSVLYRKTKFSDQNPPTFEEFLKFIAGQAPTEMERHWAIQHDAILYPIINFDFIGKQENLIPDLLASEKLIYGRDVFDKSALESVNVAPRITNAGNKMKEYYNDRTIRIVAEIYKSDFDSFGYSYDPPNMG